MRRERSRLPTGARAGAALSRAPPRTWTQPFPPPLPSLSSFQPPPFSLLNNKIIPSSLRCGGRPEKRFFKCRCLTMRRREDLTLWRPDRRLPPAGPGPGGRPRQFPRLLPQLERKGLACCASRLSGCCRGCPPGSTPAPPGWEGRSSRLLWEAGVRGGPPHTLSGLQPARPGEEPEDLCLLASGRSPSLGLRSFPAGEGRLVLEFALHTVASSGQAVPFSQLPLTACSPTPIASWCHTEQLSVCLSASGGQGHVLSPLHPQHPACSSPNPPAEQK